MLYHRFSGLWQDHTKSSAYRFCLYIMGGRQSGEASEIDFWHEQFSEDVGWLNYIISALLRIKFLKGLYKRDAEKMFSLRRGKMFFLENKVISSLTAPTIPQYGGWKNLFSLIFMILWNSPLQRTEEIKYHLIYQRLQIQGRICLREMCGLRKKGEKQSLAQIILPMMY